MNHDATLLGRYLEEGSEPAFAELVERYINLVYAAAVRRTFRHADLAQEVVQQVFISFARHARHLEGHPALGAWLHTATRHAAINLMKAESRRRARETVAAADPALAAAPEPPWEQLRPLLDEAIDELPERDRAAVVQRFLEQRDYASMGAVFKVSADAARMRTERALERLHDILRRRGVSSTAGALGVILGQHAVSAAPTGLAASVSAVAVTSAPLGASGLLSTIFMSKLTTSMVVAVVTAGITAIAWKQWTPTPGTDELTALRAENLRLREATAPGAAAAAVTAAADSFDQTALALARVIRDRHERSRAAAAAHAPATPAADGASGAARDIVTSSGHRNHGQATPLDAQLSFAWAADVADFDMLANLVWFDGDGRAAARKILDAMPASVRAEYASPEALYGAFLSAQTQLGPPPGPEWFAQLEPVEVGAGRVKFRRPGKQQFEFWSSQQTDAGWKVVIPAELVPVIARAVLSESFVAQVAPAKP